MSATNRAYDRWDLRLFIFSLAGTFLSLSLALGLGVIALVALFAGDPLGAQSAQWASAIVFTLAAMGAPALYQSGRALFGRPTRPAARPSRRWLAVAFLFPVGLALGYLAYDRATLSFLLGPLGQILAMGAPAVALTVLVRRAGPALRPRRVWGHFLLGLWVVPVVALLVEGALLLLTVLVVSVGLSTSPAGLAMLDELQQMAALGDPSLAAEALAKFAFRPPVILLVTLFLTVLVPVVEETLKTATVWPWLRRRIPPGEAFLAGALGGTGFALSEALFLARPMTGWLVTATARMGATLMHATGTGIAAWAVAEGLVRHRWRRAAAGLLAAVGLHSLWNAGAIAVGLSQLAIEAKVAAPESLLTSIGAAGLALVLGLAGLALAALQTFPRRLAEAEVRAGPPAASPGDA